jgi:hypothetical protein
VKSKQQSKRQGKEKKIEREKARVFNNNKQHLLVFSSSFCFDGAFRAL